MFLRFLCLLTQIHSGVKLRLQDTWYCHVAMRQARMILQRRLVIRLCHYLATSESAMPRRMRMGRQMLAPPIPSGWLAHSKGWPLSGVYVVEADDVQPTCNT